MGICLSWPLMPLVCAERDNWLPDWLVGYMEVAHELIIRAGIAQL